MGVPVHSPYPLNSCTVHISKYRREKRSPFGFDLSDFPTQFTCRLRSRLHLDNPNLFRVKLAIKWQHQMSWKRSLWKWKCDFDCFRWAFVTHQDKIFKKILLLWVLWFSGAIASAANSRQRTAQTRGGSVEEVRREQVTNTLLLLQSLCRTEMDIFLQFRMCVFVLSCTYHTILITHCWHVVLRISSLLIFPNYFLP